ncbi:putative glycoside hydrolase [Haloferula sp.]|uniref:putative glycoside hydrolase n=1 Tax=Haloferula sp. TaxID=2497595 RepID=UPI003C7102A3
MHGAPIVPADWSKVRLYGHAYNIGSGIGSGWNNSQLDIIEQNFHLFTTEKRHARDYWGTSLCTEQASRVSSKVYHDRNSDIEVLFYWNSALPYEDVFESSAAALNAGEDFVEPHGRSWPGTLQWKWSNPEFTDWWVGVANGMVDAAPEIAQISGVFVDAVVKTDVAGYGAQVKAAMDALNGIVIFNGFRVLDTTIQAGPEYLDHADGVYVEAFLSFPCDTTAERKLLIDTLLDVATDKYIICRGGEDFEDALAAYLIVANDYTFFRWDSSGYDHRMIDDIPNHPEYGYALGEPLSDAVEYADRYERVFENCTAVWYPGNPAASSITWGQDNSAGQSFSEFMAGYPSLTGKDAQPQADPEGDGLANIVEQWLALDPTISDAGSDHLPRLHLGASPVLTYTYDSRVIGSILQLWTGDNLGRWDPVTLQPEWITPDGELRDVAIPVDPTEARRFWRFGVER